jgi:primary-amine oxidase
MSVHPLAPLDSAEFEKARAAVVKLHGGDTRLFFRCIYLREPVKPQLAPFLELEHAGKLTDETPRPPRQAIVQYDVIEHSSKTSKYTTSIITLDTGEEVSRETADQKQQTSYSP